MSTSVINVYDDIGEYGVSAQSFARTMAAAVGTDIELHICCYGGEVSHGFAIANMIKSHAGKKVAIIDGYCASAATFVAMYCDEIRMHEMSMLMIHRSAGGVFGHANELDDKARALHGIDSIMHATYKAKSGADDETVTSWMAGDMYLTPAQALAAKLCDTIIPGPSPVAAVQASAKSAKFYAMAGKLPDAVRAFLGNPSSGAPRIPLAPIPAQNTATAAMAAPTPARNITVDRKQLITALSATGALFFDLATQASESPDQDLRTLGASLLDANVLPAASALIMPLAQADSVAQEAAEMAKEMPRVYAEVCKASGFKTGLAGWVEAAAANSKKAAGAATANVDVLVEAEIQKGIKALKILPSEAARWRSRIASGDRTIADLRNNIATALPATDGASSDEVKGKATTDTGDAKPVSAEVTELTNFDL